MALLLTCGLKLLFWELPCGVVQALEAHPLLLCAMRWKEPPSLRMVLA